MMVDHLSQIIGQEDLPSNSVMEARDKMFKATKPLLGENRADHLETPFSIEECRCTLDLLSKESSPGWDCITTKFFKEFWEELAPAIVIIVNKAFVERDLESSVKKRLVKPIPKLAACSQLKHWRPISMMTVVYKLLAKLIVERMSPILTEIISPHQHGFIEGRSIYDNILATINGGNGICQILQTRMCVYSIRSRQSL